MDEFKKYRDLAEQGATPNDISLVAKANGVHFIQRIKLVWKIFGLSHAEAKEVTIVADGLGTSLSDYQAQFIPALEEALREMEEEENDT